MELAGIANLPPQLYIGDDNGLKMAELRDKTSGNYVQGADVSVQLRQLDGTLITTVDLTWNIATPADYYGILPASTSATLSQGTQYSLTFICRVDRSLMTLKYHRLAEFRGAF